MQGIGCHIHALTILDSDEHPGIPPAKFLNELTAQLLKAFSRYRLHAERPFVLQQHVIISEYDVGNYTIFQTVLEAIGGYQFYRVTIPLVKVR